MTSATALSPEMQSALSGFNLNALNPQPAENIPPLASNLSPQMKAALSGITGLSISPTSDSRVESLKNRLSSAGHKVGEVLSGAAGKGADFVKNNADFLSAFIAGGAVSVGVAVGLHRPDLAITFPMLTFIAGEIIPQGLVGVYKGLSQIERSRIGKPLIGIGKEFTQARYDKLQNGIVRRVIDRLTKTLAKRTYNKIMGGVFLGGAVGAVIGGAMEYAYQVQVPHATGGRESQANTDGAFRRLPSHQGDVPPSRLDGVDVDRNDAFHFPGSDTVNSDAPQPPLVEGGSPLLDLGGSPVIVSSEVAHATEILSDPTVHTTVAGELLNLPQFADNHTHEALNLASRLIEWAITQEVLTPEKMQQIIDFADKTFQTIHEAKFGAGPFDLNTYRDGAGNFVLNLLNEGKITQEQHAAFQAVNFPAGHVDKVAAWQQLFNIFLGGKG